MAVRWCSCSMSRLSFNNR